jgi:SAM-dependent methyltransferase
VDDHPTSLDAWQALAEAYASRVETKAHNALYERPATLSLLPPVRGKRVLDAGCGPGVCALKLLEEGAEVVGFDCSPKMVELARQRVGDRAEIVQADLRGPLQFAKDRDFDIVLSSLAMDYVADWNHPFREFSRVLRPSGCLVFSVGHPFDGFYRFRDRANYFRIEAIEEMWTGFGFEIIVPFHRRPLSEMLNPLIAAGFHLESILEPRPLDEFRDAEPEDYEKLMKQPGFICFRARKPMAP